jgi:GDP-4-dehydro-6-deoxy-D-mannose reductase
VAGLDVLVTGADGFVGRHVLERGRLSGLTVRPSEGDLREASVADELVGAAAPRAVVHLAAAPRGGDDPWLALADDLAMAGAVLRAVGLHAPGAPVLFPGSAAQYGLGEPRRLTEDDPTAPVSAYGASKCILEQAVTGPLRGGVRVIVARSFNLIGPGQKTDAPAAQWARQAAAAEGNGDGTLRTGNLEIVRDYLDVRDIADAYLALVRSPAEGIVNVCSGVPVPMRRVAELVVERSTVPLSIEHDPALARGVDPPFIVGDPTRLHDLTGWSPQLALDQSIADLLDACRRDVVANSPSPAP